MSDQISIIVIKVDLGCEKCYNKIRQVLCKYHCQIQSKTFDDKNNIVIVTGWFHPCKFSKKLRCKAGKAIISIEIMKKKEPQPPPPVQPPPPPPPVQSPPPPVQPPTPPVQPPPEPAEPEPEPEPQKIIIPYFVPGYPPWYAGYGGAPCYEGYGMPVVPVPPQYQFPSKPPICHEPTVPPCRCGCYYGRPPPCSCGCGGYRRCATPCSCGCGGYRRCATPCSCGCGGYRRCATPCDYFTEENPNSCSIM